MFRRLLGCYIIYSFSGVLAPIGILPGTKFTFRLSLAFSYIFSATAWHSSSGRQTNFAAFSRGRHLFFIFGRAAITLGIGPHSSVAFSFFSASIIDCQGRAFLK